MKRWMLNNAGQVSTNYDLPTYLDMIRRSPWQAAKEIMSCVAILAVMFGACWLKEILLWIERAIG